MRHLAAAAASRPRLLVAAVAAGAYANTLPNQPVFDDGWAIFDNPLVKSLANVPRMFREEYNFGGNASNAGVWRPVTTLTYALNWAAGGRDVVGYHLVNLALHALACVLVLELARRAVAAVAPERAPAAALAAALLFALHPVHVEAVAGLVGRAELLSAVFSLSALLLALGAGRRRWRLPAAAAALAAGVLSKESAAVTPVLYALCAWAVPAAAGLPARPGLAAGAPRRALRSAGARALVLLAAAALPFALRPRGVGVPLVAAWFAGQPREVVAGTMSRVFAEYLRLLVLPWPLGVDFWYSARIPMLHLLSAPSIAGAAVWGGALALGVALLRRGRPIRGMGILWIFVPLLPVSNVLVPTGVLVAERLLYLPSVGFCLAAGDLFALGVAAAGRRRRPWAAAVPAALVLALAGGKTASRNLEWRDGLSLWEAEVAKTPGDPVMNNNLAVEYNRRGRYAEARERLRVALDANPWYWRAWVNLGIAEQRTGEPDAALAAYRRARLLAPDDAGPRRFAGLLLSERGDLAGAAGELEAAARLAPEDGAVRRELGTVLLRAGRLDEAREELARAVRLDPRDAEARARLAEAEAAARAAPATQAGQK